ncbi:MAG: hypothetical protein Kapaf2KO_08230 [Candidatus Kapaibacteriales bacterium]
MTRTISIPQPSGYGALELKQTIGKNTLSAFAITFSVIPLIALFFYISFLFKPNDILNKIYPGKITTISVVPQTQDVAVMPPALPAPPQEIVQGGPTARAGTPVPILDKNFASNLDDFANIDVMGKASAKGGNGLDMAGFSPNIDFADVPLDVTAKEVEPDPDDYIDIDQDVNPDMSVLYQYLVYPEMAKKAGIQGKVIIRALIDKDGSVKRTVVLKSDNSILDPAAIDAIEKAGTFTIATQNGRPVMYWTTIPFTFKLR